jgi:MFS transporter, OFA family, oxalate/formate antiporter
VRRWDGPGWDRCTRCRRSTLYAVAGLGNAFVYCCSTALGLKWFPDKRGVASGLIAAGYGSGAALLQSDLFGWLIGSVGYRETFLGTGIVLGILILACGTISEVSADGVHCGAAAGRAAEDPQAGRAVQFDRDAADAAVLRAVRNDAGGGNRRADGDGPGGAGGAQFQSGRFRAGHRAVIEPARQRGEPLRLGLGFRFAGTRKNHGRRVYPAGHIPGQRGDARTARECVVRGDDGAGVPHLGRIYVLFPAVLADMFGARHAASNYSFLYSTKGVASILGGGLAALLFEKTGTWDYAFYISAGLALCSAIVGAVVLLQMPLPKKAQSITSQKPTSGPPHVQTSWPSGSPEHVSPCR